MIDLSGVFRLDYTTPLGRPGWKEPLYIRNGPMLEGLNYLLNTAFRGGSQQGSWFIGLISGTGFGEVSEDDTLASHAGWAEFSNGGANRRVWSPAAAAGGVVSSATNINLLAAGSIRGIFLASAISGTSGILYSSAIDVNGGITVAPAGTYPGGIGYPPQVGGVLSITYTLRMRPRS